MRMLKEDDDNDVEVTWEDQQQINAFSRLNNRLADVEHDLKQLHDQRDACDDLNIEIELVDEDDAVLYMIGDAFVSVHQPRALELLESDTARLDAEINKLKAVVEGCEEEMSKLKVNLYAKFGKSNINLERD
ncbi:unnamed protein product [Tilletia controversa]|uniref:Prefoldin subunit 4 n=3 Tax=Tilletia TaxID=13289 RepID=A0A8X7SVG9_9BASI|nr:hypothetical protein CF336_g5479 [Tilletia laevis]KAE8192742.1 hypothetical protein CF328_g5264 [Tilletia controversa]KAE8256820.1 hypothetical protein A4X03_0g5023 [Tilletia caries]KAE8196123.1 hypothetical protein CF335_g4936 [Tilletia laevis]KAE8243680.1 hypothetical protein A4X06_0g6155 [Tilletia controversa]